MRISHTFGHDWGTLNSDSKWDQRTSEFRETANGPEAKNSKNNPKNPKIIRSIAKKLTYPNGHHLNVTLFDEHYTEERRKKLKRNKNIT